MVGQRGEIVGRIVRQVGPTASRGIIVSSCSPPGLASCSVSATISPTPQRMPTSPGRGRCNQRLVQLGAVLRLLRRRWPACENMIGDIGRGLDPRGELPPGLGPDRPGVTAMQLSGPRTLKNFPAW